MSSKESEPGNRPLVVKIHSFAFLYEVWLLTHITLWQLGKKKLKPL